MSRILTAFGLAGGLAALAGTAHAQEKPKFLPTRDVAVTYHLSGGAGGGQTTHMYYSDTAGKLRIDTPNNAGFTILDRKANQQTLVMNQERAFAVVPLPAGAADGFILNDTMTYRRQGQQTIDGLPCTAWAVSSEQAVGTACVTEDGVLLSGGGHQLGSDSQQTSLTAVNVAYGPQPATLFTPPAGFHQMSAQQLQQMAGGGQGGPPGGGDAGPPGGSQYGQYGGPPQGGQYGAPPGGAYGGPPPNGQYGSAPGGGYGGPPGAGGYGGPPGAGGYGGPPGQ